jgi:hypothetical protein
MVDDSALVCFFGNMCGHKGLRGAFMRKLWGARKANQSQKLR